MTRHVHLLSKKRFSTFCGRSDSVNSVNSVEKNKSHATNNVCMSQTMFFWNSNLLPLKNNENEKNESYKIIKDSAPLVLHSLKHGHN